MTDTYGTLRDAIADEIHEPSDAPVIGRMIQSALKFYKSKRFLFSEATDIIPVSSGNIEIKGARPPHIQRPIKMTGQQKGSVEGLYHRDDGRNVLSPEVDPVLDQFMDFEYERTEQRGTDTVMERFRWDPDDLPNGFVTPYWTNPETGVQKFGGSVAKVPDVDGYVWTEVRQLTDESLEPASPGEFLWDFGLKFTGPTGGETIFIDQMERHITYLNQLPTLLGAIDNIHVDSSSGIWHTMTRVTMQSLRAHQTSRVLRGVPNVWAWHAQTLYLYPGASRDLRLRIDYIKDATRDEDTGFPFDPDNSPDSFTNPFFYEGGELILTRACALYALRRVHDEDMANRFKLANQEIENALKLEMARPVFSRHKTRGYWSENRGAR